MVAKILDERREYPIVDVIEGLAAIAQPQLLQTKEKNISTTPQREGAAIVETLIAPVSRILKK
jgi:hypothetical protein